MASLLNLIIFSFLLIHHATFLLRDSVSSASRRICVGLGEWHGLLLEILMTVGLVYNVYATAFDPKRGSLSTIDPLAIGFVLGANIVVGGPFDGASVNPARAFGSANVGWRWRHHWVYWVGPLLRGGLAGVVYEFVMISEETLHSHQPLAPEDY